MKKLFILLLLLTLVFAVSACSDSNENAKDANYSQKINDTTKESIPSNLKELQNEPFLTGEHFPDTNDFIIHQFQMKYDKSDKSIHYLITYSLGKTPLNYLINKNHSYYFYLTLPDTISYHFVASETQPVKGAKIVSTDVNTKYQVELKGTLAKNASSKVIDLILKKPEQYTLTLYEDPSYPAKQVVGVHEYAQSFTESH